MNRSRTIVILLAALLLSAVAAVAQGGKTGGIKGKVRVKGEGPTADVTVVVSQNEREVAQTTSNGKGEFQVQGLEPGTYSLTLRKTGLSVGTLNNIQVKAGKTRALPDRLILTINEASIARVWGSVFNQGGYSVPNVRIELARVEADGRARKIDGRLTNESGQVVFKLSPEKAIYRMTVIAEGAEAQVKDVEVDGAMVYRVAFTIERPPK
ncbi:MAG TPA: carboxypeptidase-like regulatory domain-containing protein [Pyrinomonadaceae bacterium]